jgi:hypothetical protein
MSHLSPEFWAIVGVGFLLWSTLAHWALRIEAALGRIETHLGALEQQGETAWVVNQAGPDVSELGSR